MGYTQPKPQPSIKDLEYPIIIHPILIREGTIGDCPNCGSTTVKRWIWFGKIIGCINPGCSKYYK
jgi:hypothetical protein